MLRFLLSFLKKGSTKKLAEIEELGGLVIIIPRRGELCSPAGVPRTPLQRQDVISYVCTDQRLPLREAGKWGADCATHLTDECFFVLFLTLIHRKRSPSLWSSWGREPKNLRQQILI